MRRLMDLGLALAGIVLTSPLWLAAAVAIKLTSSGPVFFRGERLGLGARRFRLYKFRTMRQDAAYNGPGITAAGDPRITVVGRILRRFKIDELPQLLNVVRGEMALVGPRPEDPRYLGCYAGDYSRVLDVLPGLTSPATLKYVAEEGLLQKAPGPLEEYYAREILPAKLTFELAYLKRRTLWTDLKIMLVTVLAVFAPTRLSKQLKSPLYS